MTPRRICLGLALVALAVAFFVVRPKPTPGPALRDFESYYAAGVTWHYHGDPYGRDVWRTERTIPGVVATRDELLPFVGPPFGLPLWEAVARLPWSGAAVVWQIVLAVSLAILTFGTLRLARGRIDACDAPAALAFAAGFGPLTSGIALGQVAVPRVRRDRSRPVRSRARASCSPRPRRPSPPRSNPISQSCSRRASRGRRSYIAFAFAAAIAAGGSLAALGGPGGLAAYATVLRAHAAAERFIAIQTAPAAVLRALGASAHLAGTIALTLAVVTICGIALQCASRRYGANERLALACAAAPLALPFAHEHDFTIAFFPALLIVRRARGTAWVLAAFAALAVAADWLGLAQRPTGIAESAFLSLDAGLALVVLARGAIRPYHFIPLATAAAIAIAGHRGRARTVTDLARRARCGFPRAVSRTGARGVAARTDPQRHRRARAGVGRVAPRFARRVRVALGRRERRVARTAYGAGDTAALGIRFHAASAAAGSLSIRLRNIVSCQS